MSKHTVLAPLTIVINTPTSSHVAHSWFSAFVWLATHVPVDRKILVAPSLFGAWADVTIEVR